MQRESQMGLHFDPEGSAKGGYVLTNLYYWREFEESFDTMSDRRRLMVEAGFHHLGEIEHNMGDSTEEGIEFLMTAMIVKEFVKDSLYHLDGVT